MFSQGAQHLLGVSKQSVPQLHSRVRVFSQGAQHLLGVSKQSVQQLHSRVREFSQGAQHLLGVSKQSVPHYTAEYESFHKVPNTCWVSVSSQCHICSGVKTSRTAVVVCVLIVFLRHFILLHIIIILIRKTIKD